MHGTRILFSSFASVIGDQYTGNGEYLFDGLFKKNAIRLSYDVIRIGSILHDISSFNDLENLNIRDIQDLSDQRNFYAASMILFALLNRVFDLGSEVIIAHRGGIPHDL